MVTLYSGRGDTQSYSGIDFITTYSYYTEACQEVILTRYKIEGCWWCHFLEKIEKTCYKNSIYFRMLVDFQDTV
jgi:hypothetical protein